MQFSKIFLSKTTRPRAFIFGIKHHLEVLYQSCSNYASGVKIDPAPEVTILHWIILGKVQTTSSLEPLMVICPNSTGMIPGWSPTKFVQMVLIGCISRSRGQQIGFQNAIFKNLLVWNYKVQSFHIWYIASSRGPLPKLFKLCPCRDVAFSLFSITSLWYIFVHFCYLVNIFLNVVLSWPKKYLAM